MTNPNDPAFIDAIGEGFKHGLTKREYFACEFAKSFLQGPHWMALMESNGGQYDWKHISEASIGMANAFIAELNNTENVRRQAEGLK